MSINAWNNWVEIDVDSHVTFSVDVISAMGVADVQYYDADHWVVDSFIGTVHNLNTGEDQFVNFNYRDNFNDPFFQRIREHITGHYRFVIQEAIREQTDRADAGIRRRNDRANRNIGKSYTGRA